MELLVLGGTSFVGRAIVDTARAAGDQVTLFGRGRTGPELFPDAERRIGDRDTGDYTALATGSWDAVVDVSGYVPRHVAQAAAGLGDRIGRYLFISTVSVYDREPSRTGTDEQAARLPAERGTETITGDTYGPLKVACEDEAGSRLGDRATIVRPGVVAGPYDPTDRFTYWVRRAARGGRVALTGRPDQPVQVVDSGDLAALVHALLTADMAGTYNAVGPAEPVTMAGLVQSCARALGGEVDLVPVAPATAPAEQPLVLGDPGWDVMFRRSPAAAHAAGMPATPLGDTARAVRDWDLSRGEPTLTVGLSTEQEATLLGR